MKIHNVVTKPKKFWALRFIPADESDAQLMAEWCEGSLRIPSLHKESWSIKLEGPWGLVLYGDWIVKDSNYYCYKYNNDRFKSEFNDESVVSYD